MADSTTTPEPLEIVLRWRRYAVTVARRLVAGMPWLADDAESDALFMLWRMACSPKLDRTRDPRPLVSIIAHRAATARRRIEIRRNPAALLQRGSGSGDEYLDPLDLAVSREADPAAAFETADSYSVL